jgi:RNA polymerase sigma factor (sigma-70 family)
VTSLDEPRRRLAAKYRGWAAARGLAWARRGRAADRQELVAAALLGLCKAAARYRRRTGCRFTGYARAWVDGECRRELRRCWGRQAGTTDEGLEELEARPGAEPVPPEFAPAWAALPDRQRQVLMWRHGLGETYQATATALGVCLPTVRADERRALAALRLAIAGADC